MHAEWFSQSKGLELLPLVGIKSLQLIHFSSTCAVHTSIEGCEGWWLSYCCSLVVEYWLNKPDVLGSILASCWPSLFSPQNI